MSYGIEYITAIMLCIFAASCGTTSAAKKAHPIAHRATGPKMAPLTDRDKERLLAIAKNAVGQSRLKVGKKSFRNDCSGTIRALFTKARIGLGGIVKRDNDNDVKAIYRYVQKYGLLLKDKPAAGDLVFFHNTYDRSRNGHMNDALTHVGLVEKVDGTNVCFIHHLGASIIRSRMDLTRPHITHDPATNFRINHILRRAQGEKPAFTAAELFASFGRL